MLIFDSNDTNAADIEQAFDALIEALNKSHDAECVADKVMFGRIGNFLEAAIQRIDLK